MTTRAMPTNASRTDNQGKASFDQSPRETVDSNSRDFGPAITTRVNYDFTVDVTVLGMNCSAIILALCQSDYWRIPIDFRTRKSRTTS